MFYSIYLKKEFSSIEKCYIPLLNNEVKRCIKCGNNEFYHTIKNYEKSCKKCKTRHKTTYKTLFHNIRFGLLKAFHFYIDVVYEKPQPKTSELARRYNLTYKTAYNFKKKVIINKSDLDLDVYLKNKQLYNEEKLIKLLDKKNQ